MPSSQFNPVTGKMSVLPAMNPQAPALASIGPPPPTGFLSRAAGKVGGFLGTTGGGMLMAGALQGYGQGQIAEAELEEKKRIEGLWNSPEGMAQLLEVSRRPQPIPENWGQGAMIPWQLRQAGGYPPSVNYEQQG